MLFQIVKRHGVDESPVLSFMMDVSKPNLWWRVINPPSYVDTIDYKALERKVELEQEFSTAGQKNSLNIPIKNSLKRQNRPRNISSGSVEVFSSANGYGKGNISGAQNIR